MLDDFCSQLEGESGTADTRKKLSRHEDFETWLFPAHKGFNTRNVVRCQGHNEMKI